MAERLGFIGLGNMGSRLAANISADHGPLTVWDRTASTMDERSPKNAQTVDSIEELVRTSDIVFICVSNDEADRDVFSHIVTEPLAGKVIVDCSTVSPHISVELAKEVEEKGGKMLDAGLSGSVPQVEVRKLIIVVGGDSHTYESCKKYLEPLSDRTFYMGLSGSGLVMKLCINILLGVGVQSLAEAIVLGQKSGLDRTAIIDVLAATAVVSPSQKIKLETAKQESYSVVAFALSLMYKDFGLMIDQAQRVNAPLPITAASRQIAASALATGQDADFSVIIKTLENMAHVKSNGEIPPSARHMK
jgi:3-hydroxyisobutyrate dehydrogenase